MMRWQVWAREATGAGKRPFTSVPASASISATASTPWLLGTSGSSIALSA